MSLRAVDKTHYTTKEQKDAPNTRMFRCGKKKKTSTQYYQHIDREDRRKIEHYTNIRWFTC